MFLMFQPTDTTDGAPTSEAAEPKLVIWGTDVVVSETKEKFKTFLLEFTIDELDEMNDGFDPLQPLYMQKLEEVNLCNQDILIANSLLKPLTSSLID